MVVIFNFFDYYLDDVEQPLWVQVLVAIFICATIFWTFLVIFGLKFFIHRISINGICSPGYNSRFQALKKSLGITKSALSIETDVEDETSHTYSRISMRHPRNYESCNIKQ